MIEKQEYMQITTQTGADIMNEKKNILNTQASKSIRIKQIAISQKITQLHFPSGSYQF